MPRRFISFSTYPENDVPSDPPGFQPKIEYIDHHASVPGLTAFFPGLEAEDLPAAEAWAYERVERITHNGTHLDSPYYHASTIDTCERPHPSVQVSVDWARTPEVKPPFTNLP